MTQETYQDYEPGYTGNAFMYNWVFHFNPYTELWVAIHRDDYMKYWDKLDCQRCIKSKNISDLKDLLYKTKGDVDEIEKLING
jgi:hypothetical protein